MRFAATGRLGLFAALAIVGSIILSASQMGPSHASGFDRFVANLWPEAQRAGVSRSTFDRAFRGVRPDPEIIERAESQPEFIQPIWEYLDRRLTERRIGEGRTMRRQHARLLRDMEGRYGVEGDILVSIWGLESNYGDNRGDKYVIEALATLAYTGSRKRFGRSQLIAALKILEKGDISRNEMMGSWAGAMGHTQFIPTTYEAYAVDWTGDGRRDVWRSHADALASAASYLSRMGWKKGLRWGWEVTLPRGFDYGLTGLGTRKSIADWTKLGVRPARGGRFGEWAPQSSVIAPAGAGGPAFLVTQNFRTIMRYNNAVSYALSVGLLADRIAGGKPLVKEWPRDALPLSTEEQRRSLQTLLNKRGYDAGTVDGLVGPRTERAVKDAQRDIGWEPDGYPTTQLLERLRQGS